MQLPVSEAVMFFKKKAPVDAPIHHADDGTFDEIVTSRDGVAVVDFWAPWCAPCHMMAPILDEVAIETADRGVRIVKVNVDEAPEVSSGFGIRSVPTLMFFRDGEPEFEMVGLVPKPVLEREIQALLDGTSEEAGPPGEE
jgi:thioredoxin 1